MSNAVVISKAKRRIVRTAAGAAKYGVPVGGEIKPGSKKDNEGSKIKSASDSFSFRAGRKPRYNGPDKDARRAKAMAHYKNVRNVESRKTDMRRRSLNPHQNTTPKRKRNELFRGNVAVGFQGDPELEKLLHRLQPNGGGDPSRQRLKRISDSDLNRLSAYLQKYGHYARMENSEDRRAGKRYARIIRDEVLRRQKNYTR